MQCVCCTHRLQCTTYIKPIYFVHPSYIYQSITDYLYVKYIVGCTKIWRFHQKITEPSQKLGHTIMRNYANF